MGKKRFDNMKYGMQINKRRKIDAGGDHSVMDKIEKEETEDHEFNEWEEDEDEEKMPDSRCKGKSYYQTKRKIQPHVYRSASYETSTSKRGRIIVRNLPFTTTEEQLHNHFKDFGAISEVKLLRKADGMLVGCGFIQFAKKQYAIQAILKRSGKPFLGRPIVCDWALPQNEYLVKVKSEMEPSRKEDNIDEVKIKEEPCSEDDNAFIIKNKAKDEKLESEDQEEEEDDDDDDNYNDYDHDYDDEKREDEDDDGITDDSYDSDKSGTETSSIRKKKGNLAESKRPRVISNDVTEGCTIFVKNIPFTATNKDLEKCMKQFGSVHYALICIDPHTEHSKGTGFVKFKNIEDAENCLKAEELSVRDEIIEVMKALPRNDIKSMHEKKKEKKVKDSRHLYLVKEGVILAGSPAAKDVSVFDMEKRLKIEQWKTQMLRNLNMFVSNTRLVVYNIPVTWTDNQVRTLFKQHAGSGAIIKEARIMKDLRNVDSNGEGKSKEFAFVHFTQHEHALQALRNINNNPKIFSKLKRPIVSFSIENKAIHKLKQKRLQKSRIANAEKQNQNQSGSADHRRNNKKQNVKQRKMEVDEGSNAYSGLVGTPGNKTLRTKFTMRTQVAMHEKNVRESRKERKRKQQMQEHKKKFVETQPKKKHREEKDSFGELVDKYKLKLMSAESVKRWYE